MKKIVVSFFVLTLLLTLTTLAQETITLSTYYPSPFGIYNRLATNSFGVGDNNSSGGIEAGDSPDPAVAGQEGDVWIAGDIGIGTTNPEARVHISGDSPISMIEATQANQAAHLYLRTPTAIWQLEADSGGIDEGFRIDESTTSMGDSGTTRFVIRNGGRVGIGTRNPRARLDVDGGIRVGQVDATGSGAGNCAASGCSADNAGTLRYCNNKIQFCKGSTSSWEQTGGGGLLGAFAWLQINITDATKVGDITMDMTNIQADGKPAIVGPVKNAEIGSAVVEGDFVSGKYILAAIGRSKISYAHTPPVNQIIAQNIYVSRNSTGRLRVWTTDHPSITGGGTQFITVMAFQRR